MNDKKYLPREDDYVLLEMLKKRDFDALIEFCGERGMVQQFKEVIYLENHPYKIGDNIKCNVEQNEKVFGKIVDIVNILLKPGPLTLVKIQQYRDQKYLKFGNFDKETWICISDVVGKIGMMTLQQYEDNPVKDGTKKIGKVFRELKQIYKPQNGNTSINQKHNFKSFRESYIELGMEVNNLNYCQYYLKNGLPYYGMKGIYIQIIEATSKLERNSELIKIPYNLLITCKTAYESELKKIYDDNPQYFIYQTQIDSQNKILIVFLIYQLQIGSKSKWYKYIKNLPKTIESFSFWTEQEQQQLNDSFLTDYAKREKDVFYEDYEKFRELTLKYKHVFDESFITFEIFQRAVMIVQTRTFGDPLPNISLIPFVDLLNHECVDVYYDLNYREQNGKAIKQQDEIFQEQKQQDTDSSTDGSYDSLDIYEEDQFNLDGFKSFLFNKEYDSDEDQMIQETFLEKYNQTQVVDQNTTISYQSLIDSFDYQTCQMGDKWVKINAAYVIIKKLNDQIFTSKLEKTISLFIAGQFNSIIDEYISQYMFDQINSYELFNQIRQLISEFTSQRSQLESLQSTYKHQVLECQQNTLRENFKVVEDQDTNIKYFVMSTSHKDQFQTNSQVYYCYGRLSNMQLLLRYGFSLEYNKYDHVYIKLNYLDYANCRHTVYLAHERQVQKTKIITLRYTRFPTEFVQFCKALTFQYKIHNTISIFIIDQYSQEHYGMLLAIKIIENHIDKYLNFDETQLAKQLTDPNLKYHQYFSIIYRLEQQRICTQNINLLKMAIMMIEDKIQYKKIDINSTKYDFNIPKCFITPYKYMIAKYFKQCQFKL